MTKPLNNITFIIISFIFIGLFSFSIYQNHMQFEYLKQNKETVAITIPQDINKTGFFNSMYIKTKNMFK